MTDDLQGFTESEIPPRIAYSSGLYARVIHAFLESGSKCMKKDFGDDVVLRNRFYNAFYKVIVSERIRNVKVTRRVNVVYLVRTDM